jgi:hypothetical protein
MQPWLQHATKYYAVNLQKLIYYLELVMGTTTTTTASLSNAIVGSFDPINGMPANVKNTWSFEYNQSQNLVNFSIQVGIPPMLVDNSSQSLQATISIDDLESLISWFSIVKMQSNSSSSSNKK